MRTYYFFQDGVTIKNILPVFFFLTVVFSAQQLCADEILLRNGNRVVGTILSEKNGEFLINMNGMEVTYYQEEIQSVTRDAPQAPPDAFPPVLPAAQPIIPPAQVMVVKPEKKQVILKFVEVFGTRQNMERSFNEMLEKLPEEQAQSLYQVLNVDEIIENLVPIYDQYFTEDELRFYIDFYSSPRGKKLIDTMPTLMQKSVDESLKYLQDKFPQEPPSSE